MHQRLALLARKSSSIWLKLWRSQRVVKNVSVSAYRLSDCIQTLAHCGGGSVPVDLRESFDIKLVLFTVMTDAFMEARFALRHFPLTWPSRVWPCSCEIVEQAKGERGPNKRLVPRSRIFIVLKVKRRPSRL